MDILWLLDSIWDSVDVGIVMKGCIKSDNFYMDF